jgi:acyl-coenzyme A thioesterase PaaI-like protein
MVNPPPPLLAGSEDDIKQKTSLYTALDHNLKLAEFNEPDRYIFWDPYSVLPREQRKHHLVASSLSSSSALGGYQRIFQDKTTGDVYSLLHFGPAVTGWPRLVHGGALATALDETCGRVAFARLGRAASGKDRPIVTAKLKVDYLKMTRADRAYIVGARVMRDDELEPEERGKGHYKAHIEAWVKDPKTNEKNVVARALYIGPKPREGEVVEADDGCPMIVPPERRF